MMTNTVSTLSRPAREIAGHRLPPDNPDRESGARTYGSVFKRRFVRAELSRVWDEDGKEYLDCLAGAGALPLGHNHPAMVTAAVDYLSRQGLTQALDLSTADRSRFIEELYACLPAPCAESMKIQFCGPTGADAVEAAIKLFKWATGRRSIFCFQGGYHGMTAGALSLTGNLKGKAAMPGLMGEVYPFPFPRHYDTPSDADAENSLKNLRAALEDPESGIPKPAAVILEVVQGEGGVLPAPDAWLRALADLLRRHEVPLVIDEVQTGFGRTGTMFAFERAGVVPDAIILSKSLGGGFPLSVLLYRREYDRWPPGAHAGTFRGNQIAMATGAATLHLIREEGLAAEAERKGGRLRAIIESVNAPCIADIRGRGLMLGVQIRASEPERGDAAGLLAYAIKMRCFENGLIIETGGRHGAVLRFLPPLVITDDEIERVGSLFTSALLGSAA